MIYFDIEADGLELDEITTIHCVCTLDDATGEERTFEGHEVSDAVAYLEGQEVCGHNAIGYDVPVLRRFYPDFKPLAVWDTLVASRLVYSGMALRDADVDAGRIFNKAFPTRAPHSLSAWGWRLGCHKGDYTGGFEKVNPEMIEYCQQDVRVTQVLWRHLRAKCTSMLALSTECTVQTILTRQKQHGFAFDEKKAVAFMGELIERRDILGQELKAIFGSWWVPAGLFTPKRDNARLGYRKGCPVQKIKLVEFNPSSGAHIARCLIQKYDWKPTALTPTGNPSTEATVLRDLPYPEAAKLAEYAAVEKVLGTLSEGDGAWLKLVKNGRIHGRVTGMGTVTHRMAHHDPNLGNVSRRGEMGQRCRSLFVAPPGKVLVGIDASGLQLRGLAHYLARWDDGAFAKIVCEQDPHSEMRKASGISLRDNQKTWTYAYLFGAGDRKLGTIVRKDLEESGNKILTRNLAKLGRASREMFQGTIEGLEPLTRNLALAASRGWLRGLDERRVTVLSKHRALNTLLMSFEAVLMKHALVEADRRLRMDERTKHSWEWVANVHDEWQIEADEATAKYVAEVALAAFPAAATALAIRCPIEAKVAFGSSWAETH